jgi:hypothetical protein
MYMADWNEVAVLSAKHAHENHFESRRGFWDFSDMPGVHVIFNNNPYAKDSNYLDKETDKIREAMQALGIVELGHATYPPDGADAGYTYAMVIRASEEGRKKIVAAIDRIAQGSWQELTS